MKRPAVLVLGPHRGAVSGVSSHVNTLLVSGLREDFSLIHFQVGSEGREESRMRHMARLAGGPVRLAAAILTHGATIVHINTSLNARAYWRDVVHMLVAKALLREQPDSAGALRLVFVGRLAIVTRVGAIPDVVFEGVHGLFVPLRSPGAIARAIARLDADRALLAQMGAACRKRIAASYSVERLTGDVRRLYADLFSGAAR